MSLHPVIPEALAAVRASLEDLGSALRGASAAAVNRAAAITPPAADEVSSAITALFASHVDEFAAANSEASTFHTEFVKLLGSGAVQYLFAESADAQQTLVDALNGLAQALLSCPLPGLGDGAPEAAMTEISDVDAPFGRIEVVHKVAAPVDDGTGSVSAPMSPATPYEDASWSITGSAPAGETPATIILTGGSNQLPPQLRLLGAAGGSMVTGGVCLLDGVGEASNVLSSGDHSGAASVFFTRTVELTMGSFEGPGGPTVSVHLPFGGLCTPSAPVMLSVPGYSSTDDAGSV